MVGKKGISAIVATVLLILVSVAAVVIVWGAVIPMINDQIDKGTLCLDAMGQITVGSDQRYTCWNNVSGSENLSLEIIRTAKEFALADIQVLVSSGGSTTSFSLVDDVTTLSPASMTPEDLPKVNEAKIFVIDVSGVSGDIDSIKIAPVIPDSGSGEFCDISSTVEIKTC
jgi:hypothetical protein